MAGQGRVLVHPDFPWSILGGWVLAALPGVIWGTISMGAGANWTAETGATVVAFGRHLALGVICALVVHAVRNLLRPKPAYLWTAFAAATLAVGALTLPQDITGVALSLGNRVGLPAWVITCCLVGATSGGVVFVAAATRLVGTRPVGARPVGARPVGTRPVGRAERLRQLRQVLRWSVIVVCAPLAITLNLAVSPGFNPGAHLFLTWLAAIALGNGLASLHGAALFPFFSAPRWRSFASLFWTPPVASLGLAAWACLGPHSNSLQMAYLLRPDSLTWSALFVADVQSEPPEPEYPSSNPYFVSRGSLPPVGSRHSRPILNCPIVILLSIDSLRADVVTDPGYHQYLPTLQQLKGEGTFFSQTRAPAASTSRTLHAVSTGEYFSQQRWVGSGAKYRPEDEESVHWPALLRDAGTRTEFFPAIDWLSGESPLLQGFTVNEMEGERFNGGWVTGRSLTSRLIRSLELHGSKSLLLWAHYLDTHSPFAAGEPAPDKFTRYLQSLRVVDTYLREIRDAVVRLGLEKRTLLLITADHGEAFGEHNSQYHGATVYDELIKVPLLVHGPTVPSRTIDEPVSLLDLGPTILDWMAIATPPTHMGQSLVPLLHGELGQLQRPVAAESNLKRAMVFPDGIKVIVDLRHEIVEVYDLTVDPGELRNLSDDAEGKYSAHLRDFRQFFAVHAHTRDGYRSPYAK